MVSRAELTLDLAQAVISKHFPTESSDQYTVLNILAIQHTEGYSSIPTLKSYLLDLKKSNDSYLSFLTISTSSHPSSQHNSLATIASLIDLIRQRTPIPLTPPLVDFTLSVLPHEFLVSTPAGPTSSVSQLIPLPLAKSKLHLSDQEAAAVDLKIGQLLGQLHKLVQNDWFGRPSIVPPSEPSYSWQESFTVLFDEALGRALEHHPSSNVIPVEDINKAMARAIGYFLFDDVAVPSLVWFTGSATDVYLVLNSLTDGTQSLDLAAIVPSLGHAVWGDPLLETFFMDSASSKAILEGCDEELLIFPRQSTKRIWYSLYLALVMLVEREDKKAWAEKMIEKCVKDLKDAPCW
ncbi:hypothetical protein DL96DRAFT_1817902 [Flagelloscypha sp. PMI_526]|nr:hypothetical protein DL96DRAFT_1817902 [Flagelloscypha sp. PMI_526]